MTTPNTILLRGQGVHEEYPAAAGLSPGHLIEITSAGTVQKHSTAGGQAELMFATEDALQGKTTADAYVALDQVMCDIAPPGTLRLARVAANAAAIVIGDKLASAGDGTLKKPASAGSHTLYANTAASTAVSNTVSTEQFYDTTYTLPANTLQVGDVLHVKCLIVVSAAAGTDTITGKLYLGAIAIATTNALDSTTADVVVMECDITIRTIGASGTYVGEIRTANGPALTATFRASNLASSAIDTTAANIIRASSTWSATTATCTSAVQALTVTIERTVPQKLLAVAQEALDNSAVAAEAFIRVRLMV